MNECVNKQIVKAQCTMGETEIRIGPRTSVGLMKGKLLSVVCIYSRLIHFHPSLRVDSEPPVEPLPRRCVRSADAGMSAVHRKQGNPTET